MASDATATADGTRVRFRPSVTLTKREAFSVCDACARAEVGLRRRGDLAGAGVWSELRESIEARLAGPAGDQAGGQPSGAGSTSSVLACSGSNSRDRELTQ